MISTKDKLETNIKLLSVEQQEIEKCKNIIANLDSGKLILVLYEDDKSVNYEIPSGFYYFRLLPQIKEFYQDRIKQYNERKMESIECIVGNYNEMKKEEEESKKC